MISGAGGGLRTNVCPDINILISIEGAIASNPFQPFFSQASQCIPCGGRYDLSVRPSRRATVWVPSWHSADPPLGGAGGPISEAPFRRTERSEVTFLDSVEISGEFFIQQEDLYEL
jgi:hypothetical protein